MAFNEDGTWSPESDSVETRVTSLMDKKNPLMIKAATGAKQWANKRGLLNSTMAAGAGTTAALNTVLPIASQDAKQTADKNITALDYSNRRGLLDTDLSSKERIASMTVAANDREKATAAIAAMGSTYGDMFRTIATADKIPAAARNAYTEHIGRIRDANLNMVEQMYGISLDWPSTGGAVV